MKNRRMIVISALLLYAITVVACLLMEIKGLAEPVIVCVPPSGGGMYTNWDFKVCKGEYSINGARCDDSYQKQCSTCRFVVSKSSNKVRCYAIKCTNTGTINYKICVEASGQICQIIDVKDINCGDQCKVAECGEPDHGVCTACACDMVSGVPVSQQTQVNTCSTQ